MIELNWKGLGFSAVKVEDYFEVRASQVNAKNIVEEEIILPSKSSSFDKVSRQQIEDALITVDESL